MPTASEVYASNVRAMPASERLRLATIILNDLPPEAVVDYSTEWSDRDLIEFGQSGWDLIERRLSAEDHAAPR